MTVVRFSLPRVSQMGVRQVMTFLFFLKNTFIWSNTARAPTSPNVGVIPKLTDFKRAIKRVRTFLPKVATLPILKRVNGCVRNFVSSDMITLI